MRRRAGAAALWLLLAFLVWNVRFDLGVRTAASSYINQRALYLRGQGPRIEMAPAMRAGIRSSALAAAAVAAPAAVVGLWLGIAAARARQRTGAGH
jgi:hypothetical protein